LDQRLVRLVVSGFLAVLVVLILAECALGAFAMAQGIVAKGETTYPEGWMLYSMLRVRDGLPLYTDAQQFPFVQTLYMPIYYLIVGLGARMIGLSDHATLLLARGVTVMATLVSGVLIYALSRQCGLSRVGGIVAVGLFISSSIIYPWAFSTRSDLLGLAFSLAGLWIGVRWPTWRGAIAAGAVLALAVLTKQTFGAAVAGLCLAHLQRRQVVPVVLIAASWVVFVATGVVLAQSSSGGLFLTNVVATNVLPPQPELLAPRLVMIVQHAALPLGLIGLGLVLPRLPVGRPLPLLAIHWYAAVALGIAVIGTTKPGSDYNYFVELVVALAILGGRGFQQVLTLSGPALEASGQRPLLAFLPTTARILLGVVAAASMLRLSHHAAFALWYHVTFRPDNSALVLALEKMPGHVITERDALAVILAGKVPVLADPHGLSMLNGAGRWDPAPLYAMLEDGSIGVVVLDRPADDLFWYHGYHWLPAETQERVARQYRLAEQVGVKHLYVPASRP
jgi:hypothetical protein